MLEDARKILNDPKIDPVVSSGGATPIHVAAAKNYTTVLKYVHVFNYLYEIFFKCMTTPINYSHAHSSSFVYTLILPYCRLIINLNN